MTTPSGYLANEAEYRALVAAFLAGNLPAAAFVTQYFVIWKRDRDAQWRGVDQGKGINPAEERLVQGLNRIFTACDCYNSPSPAIELSEAGLRAEVSLLDQEIWPHELR